MGIEAVIEATLGERLDGLNRSVQGLPDAMAARDSQYLMDLVRGVKYMRLAFNLSPAATSFTFPPPDQGYAWDVRLITGSLTVTDSVAAYVGDARGNRLIGYAGPPGAAPAQAVFAINPSSRSAIVSGGEPIFIATSGAGSITQAMIGVLQVPAEMLGKILV